MTEIMTEGKFRQGSYDETEEDILHSEADPGGTMIQEAHSEDTTIIEIEVTAKTWVQKSIQINS